jgi:hypothetical protein
MKKPTTKKALIPTSASTPNPLIGKPVIVRANVAGVHCGILVHLDTATQTATITDAYRLWRVFTRDKSGSISDTAANGLQPNKDHSIGAKLKTVLIINPQGLEIAEATTAAYASIAAKAAS